MTPVTYFFFPETTHRSLEEMDNIFHHTTSIFNLVKVAREEPHMYGKYGERIADVEDEAVRRASALGRNQQKPTKEEDEGTNGTTTNSD